MLCLLDCLYKVYHLDPLLATIQAFFDSNSDPGYVYYIYYMDYSSDIHGVLSMSSYPILLG